MDHVPDPIERMEARIESLEDEQLKGVPNGMIRCYDCKAIVPFDSVVPAYSSPDSPAICFDCMDRVVPVHVVDGELIVFEIPDPKT